MIDDVTDYSEAELKLIEVLDPDWFKNCKQFSYKFVYENLIIDAFLNNLTGQPVDALRRVYRAIIKCSPCRMTPEFDNLCKFTNAEIYALCEYKQ